MARDDSKEYDDLSDLSPMEMESIREWEMQYRGTNLYINNSIIMLLELILFFCF